jgi:hypothetical protein
MNSIFTALVDPLGRVSVPNASDGISTMAIAVSIDGTPQEGSMDCALAALNAGESPII